jgi:hypothetical protein
MLINSPNISGSLTVTGNATITGSLTVLGGINATITGSATTASYVEYSNVANKPTLVSGSEQISFNGIVDKPTLVSGSIQVTYSGLSGIPVGIVSGSSQISFNGIADKPTLVSGSAQVTYSGLSGIPSGIVSSSVQIGEYGIFATTGSNTFVGSQTITGSIFGTGNLTINGCITATGQIVAQTINVQQVTSSIVYSCGSNIFGTSTSNTQQFTGSMLITGSNITANIGNACFAGTICSNTVSTTDGSNVSQLANNYLRSTAGNFYFDACTVGASFNFRTSNASALDSTAMFICGTNNRIGINCVTPGYALDVNGTFNVRTSTGSEVRIINYGGSSAKIRGTQSTLAIESCGAFTIESGGATERLRINENGVACFACQVCAPIAIFSGCVGIGTTSPKTILDVVTGSNTTLASCSDVIAKFKGSLELNSLSTASSGTIDRIYFNKSHTAGINVSTYTLGEIRSYTNGGFSGGLDFFTGRSIGAGAYGTCFTMRLDDAGNVGIGTTNPGNFNALTFTSPILDVIGSLNVRGIAANGASVINIGGETYRKAAIFTSIQDQDPFLGFSVGSGGGTSSSTTERMRITSGGYVGIGTTSPNNTLTVNACGANKGIDLTINNATTVARFGVIDPNVNNNPFIGGFSNNDFLFYSNSQLRLTLTNTGIATFACQVCAPNFKFGSAGNIQSCVFSIGASTEKTVTICTDGGGALNGTAIIAVGLYVNGAGTSSTASWTVGGFIGSGMAIVETARSVNLYACIGSLSNPASCLAFKVGNCFGSNTMDVSVMVISANANQSALKIY